MGGQAAEGEYHENKMVRASANWILDKTLENDENSSQDHRIGRAKINMAELAAEEERSTRTREMVDHDNW